MKYRTKLYVSFLGVALVSSILGIGIVYSITRNFLFLQIQSKVVSIAAVGAAEIDGDKLKQISKREHEGTDSYKEIQQILRRIRDANRRDDTYVSYVYTLIPSPTHPGEATFLVDAEENPAFFSHVGDIDDSAKADLFLENLGRSYSSGKLTQDEWGYSLTGYAPVYDSKGELVATIGVDLQAKDVIATLNDLIFFALWALFGAAAVALLIAYFLSRVVTHSLNKITLCVKEIEKKNLQARVHLHTKDEFGELGEAINAMAQGLQEKEYLKGNFARYVSSYVLDNILASEAPLKLAGERKKLTFLFSDIRQFTHLGTILPPETLVALLNEYLALMLDIVFKYKGTIDKFLGDGIMIEFGAPLEDLEQEEHAVMAAIEMQLAVRKLRESWVAGGKPQIEIGIGIHTGVAVVGNIGAEQRMEYTAIGDPVNMTSRLQNATKELKVPILISEETVLPIKDKFPFKSLGQIMIVGRDTPMSVYTVELPGATQS
jgi:adenylate cyclase